MAHVDIPRDGYFSKVVHCTSPLSVHHSYYRWSLQRSVVHNVYIRDLSTRSLLSSIQTHALTNQETHKCWNVDLASQHWQV